MRLTDRPGSAGAGAPVDAGPSTTALRASGRDDGKLRAELIGLRLVVIGETAGPSTTRATAARSGRDDGMRGGDLRSGRDDGEVGEWAGLGSLRQVVGEVQSSCLGQRLQVSAAGRRPRARSISKSWLSSGHSRMPRVWLPRLLSLGWTWMAS